MTEQVPPVKVTRPLNPPVRPAPPDPAGANKVEPDRPHKAGLPPGQAEPAPGITGRPSPAEASRAGTADDGAQRPWAGSPGGPHDGTKPGQKPRDAAYVEDLLLASPLALGEDRQDYEALAREIRHAAKPNDIFDQMRVADILHSVWEESRYRRHRVALSHATRLRALVALLMSFTKDFEPQAVDLAIAYLGDEPAERERARGILQHHGISDDAIDAQAAELHPQSIPALDRLIAQAQARRSGIVKDIERSRRKADKANARQSKPERPDQPELGLQH